MKLVLLIVILTPSCDNNTVFKWSANECVSVAHALRPPVQLTRRTRGRHRPDRCLVTHAVIYHHIKTAESISTNRTNLQLCCVKKMTSTYRCTAQDWYSNGMCVGCCNVGISHTHTHTHTRTRSHLAVVRNGLFTACRNWKVWRLRGPSVSVCCVGLSGADGGPRGAVNTS